MASIFILESPSTIPYATKAPPSACVYVLVKCVVKKVPWSVFSSIPWVLPLEKKNSPSKINQNCEAGDRWCCHLSTEAGVGLLPLYMGFAYQKTSPFVLNPVTLRYMAWPSKWQVGTTHTRKVSYSFLWTSKIYKVI